MAAEEKANTCFILSVAGRIPVLPGPVQGVHLNLLRNNF
jgi:hypothetical protein